MTSVSANRDRNNLLLSYLASDRVEFDLLDENGERVRAVHVGVGSGTS